MKFLISIAILCLLIASCNSEENSTSDAKIQDKVKKDTKAINENVEPHYTDAAQLKKKLLGSWADAISENAVFEVKNDSIYYTEQFKSYKYNLIKDSISIVYDDFTFEGQIQFKNDTLIMTADEYEPQKFWRFIN